MKQQLNRARGWQITAGLMAFFGLLTLFVSSAVIFDLFGIREVEGEYVPLVLWANFLVSFLYLAAAYGLFREWPWPPTILAIATVILLAAAIGLGLHVNSGAPYEQRTIGALAFRIFVTLLLYVAARYYSKPFNPGKDPTP